MAMLVLSAILEQPFYQDLRTKQQLGYIVFATYREDEGPRSLVFIVQVPPLSHFTLARRAPRVAPPSAVLTRQRACSNTSSPRSSTPRRSQSASLHLSTGPQRSWSHPSPSRPSEASWTAS